MALPTTFITFRPRKENLIAEFRVPRTDEVTTLIEDSGLESLTHDKGWGRYRVRLTKEDLAKHRDLLVDLMWRSNGTTPPIAE